jgi:host factor-I protein
MQSFFEQRGPRLDTSSPSVRHLQDLIRRASPVNIELEGGQSLQGTIRWQDHDFLAIQQDPDLPLLMVNRTKVVVLRLLS